MSAAALPVMDRIRIWQETKVAAQKIADHVPPSEKITVAMVAGAELTRGYGCTDIEIKNVECINEGFRLKEREGMRPLVLNLSDNRVAGGCIELGSGAQEESLWRRTALCVTQLQSFYPLGVEAIYSPDVPVMRAAEADGYAWYPIPKAMDFIACPAIRFPQWIHTEKEPEGDLSQKDKRELAERLRLILRVAAVKGHDAVVLGAMGCGAWGNPPRAVARVFAQVLPEFDGVFKKIVIAILNTGGKGCGKIQTAFESVFDEVFSGGGRKEKELIMDPGTVITVSKEE